MGGHSEQVGSAGWVHRIQKIIKAGRKVLATKLKTSRNKGDLGKLRQGQARSEKGQARTSTEEEAREEEYQLCTQVRHGGALPESWALLVLYTVARVTRLLPSQGCYSATPHWAAGLEYMSSFQDIPYCPAHLCVRKKAYLILIFSSNLETLAYYGFFKGCYF